MISFGYVRYNYIYNIMSITSIIPIISMSKNQAIIFVKSILPLHCGICAHHMNISITIHPFPPC